MKLLIRALMSGLALIAALACLPGTAHAGTYAVKACADGRGEADRWGANASYYVGGRIECPWTPAAGGGLSVRTSGGPNSTAGSVVFTAPPGTSVARMEGEVAITQANGWHVGIWDYQHGRWLWCGPANPCNTFGTFANFAFDNFRSAQLGAFVVCGAAACTPGSSITLKNVTTIIEDLSQPGLAVDVPSGWVRGTVPIGIDANDNVGIRRVRLLVDGREVGGNDPPSDSFRAIPCPNGRVALALSTTGQTSDGTHSLQVRATDSANNVAAVDRRLAVDNTPPGQPGEPAVEGGDGWRSTNSFDLSWLTPPQPGVAPVTAVEYELCPADRPSGDPSCRRGSRAVANPGSATSRSLLQQLEVPANGAWTARLWLRDEARNQSIDTAKTVVLRFDNEPPSLAFRPLDPEDPTRLRVQATDRSSGIARAAIELQRRGESTWRSLDAGLEDGGFAVTLDDESLPEGSYAVRARAVDHAGNERTTERFANGDPAGIALPVRVRTQLAVGQPKRVRIKKRPKGSNRRYRTKLISRARVPFGRSVRLQGRLTTPGQNPLPGTAIQVFEQVEVPGLAGRQIGTVTTSRTGRFSFRLPKGPSRIVRFRYDGTRTIRGGTGQVDIRVPASTSFSVRPGRVVNGQVVTFSGRLRGGAIPAQGKLIALQAFTRGRWRPFATVRADARTGRWDYPYRFDGTRGLVRYRFRARVLKEATYPYSTGTSGRRRVVVRGI